MAFGKFVITLDVVLVGWALQEGYVVGEAQYYFREDRLVTYLSAFQLLAIAVFCWMVFERDATATGPVWRRAGAIWALMAAGFLFLAFDETLMIHERIDFALHRLLDVRETALTDRLDDFLVLLYGVLGGALLWRSRSALVRYRSAKAMVVGGIILFALMVLLDMVTNRRDLISDVELNAWAAVAEDVAKIAAECLFLLAAHRCWRQPD